MIEKTTVEKVCVYRRSAVVTRRGKIVLESGRNTVYIAGLTQSALTDTVRLSFAGDIKTLDINYISAMDVDDQERPETAEIERQIADIDKKLEICAKMYELRELNADFTSRADVSVEAQERVISELPKQLIGLYEKTKELNDAKRKLEEELSKLQAVQNETVIRAELGVETAGTYDLELRYVEQNASWMPLYEVRYSSEKQPLEVIMKATIYQNTREDWEKVGVVLYTGNPTASNKLPVLDRTTLSISVPAPVRRRSSGHMDGMMMKNAMPVAMECMEDSEAGLAAPEFREATMGSAVVSKEETMTAYELPGKRDIIRLSEGNSAELQRFEIDAKYSLLTIPAIDTRCFMVAVIKNSDWPFPAAKAKIYIKDAYAGQVYVSTDPEKDSFELSLGVDERVTVFRKVSPEKTSEVFLKGTKKKQREYKIRVTGRASETLNVIVKDRIPVSTDKLITVENEDLSGAKLDEKEGILTWEKELKGDAVAEIRVAYSITWPKDKRLEEY